MLCERGDHYKTDGCSSFYPFLLAYVLYYASFSVVLGQMASRNAQFSTFISQDVDSNDLAFSDTKTNGQSIFTFCVTGIFKLLNEF